MKKVLCLFGIFISFLLSYTSQNKRLPSFFLLIDLINFFPYSVEAHLVFMMR